MITVKEEFLQHEKLVRAVEAAGYEALGVWMAIKSHVGTNLTDGFVADDDLVTLKLPKPLSKQKLNKCVRSLVNCGKKDREGNRGPGLLVKVDGGYEMHDYLDHANSREQVELQREKGRLKKAQQRKAAKEELQRTRAERQRIESEGEAVQGTVPDSVPSDVPRGQVQGTEEGTTEGTLPGTTAGTPPGTSRAYAGGPANPAQPNPEDPKAAEAKPRPPSKSEPPPSPEQPQRPPSNLEQAQKLPIGERARALVDNPHTQTFVQPHKWPEVQRLGSAFAAATGWHEPRWSSATGKAVMPLVRLYAEFTVEELGLAVKAAKGDEFLRNKGFSTLTDEVVRRLLSKGDHQAESSEAAQAREQEREEREAALKAKARRELESRGAA